VSQRAASARYLSAGCGLSARGAPASAPDQQPPQSRARGGCVQQKVPTAIPCGFIHISATKGLPAVPSGQLRSLLTEPEALGGYGDPVRPRLPPARGRGAGGRQSSSAAASELRRVGSAPAAAPGRAAHAGDAAHELAAGRVPRERPATPPRCRAGSDDTSPAAGFFLLVCCFIKVFFLNRYKAVL